LSWEKERRGANARNARADWPRPAKATLCFPAHPWFPSLLSLSRLAIRKTNPAPKIPHPSAFFPHPSAKVLHPATKILVPAGNFLDPLIKFPDPVAR
jgi:hypothetical protein